MEQPKNKKNIEKAEASFDSEPEVVVEEKKVEKDPKILYFKGGHGESRS